MLLFFLKNAISSWGILGEYFRKIGACTEQVIDGNVVLTDFPVVPNLIAIFVCIAVAYFLGSLNTAVIVSKIMYRDDIRNYGSGNAGFTNMMRTYGAKAAAITFAGDMLKTILAVLLAWFLRGYMIAYVAGFACFIGHILPCFCQFKGGKGVLCAASMMLVLDIRLFLLLMVVFLLAVLITKYISFGSILGAMVYPIAMYRSSVIPASWDVLIAFIIAFIVVFKHRANLKRIWNGTESKFSFKKSKKAADAPADEANHG